MNKWTRLRERGSMRETLGALAFVGVAVVSCATQVDTVTIGTDGGSVKTTNVGGDSGPTKNCGARAGVLCGIGGTCSTSSDCATHICTSSKCQAVPASCEDGEKNGTETDVDCGGSACPTCATGKTCDASPDCTSGLCLSGTCQIPTATDGVPDDSETDVDCGGALNDDGTMNPSSDGAPPCADGKKCGLPSDCVDGVCSVSPGTNDLTCQAATDEDGVKNGGETDVDCGGALDANGHPVSTSDGAPPCNAGQMCKVSTDCTSEVCTNDICQAASPTDHVMNGGETGVDCGGTLTSGSDGAPPCGTGQPCNVASDCQSAVCTAHLCAAPTASDSVQNAGESDVDCGGNTTDMAPRCADAKRCAADTDCLSGFCSVLNGTCVDGKSCTGIVTPATIMDFTTQKTVDGDAIGTPNANGAGQHAGLDTCGIGEATDPIAQQQHESCCRSLLLPGSTTVRLDKYEVTTGRLRQFAESLPVPYDLRDWAANEIANGTSVGAVLSAQIPGMVQYLPQSGDPGDAINAIQQFGATTMDPAGLQGCYVADGAFGASTYWWDAYHLGDVGSPPRPYTQDYYDIKSENCGMYWVYAAFCAWDGGRLPTMAEEVAAYGTAWYPWGQNFIPVPVKQTYGTTLKSANWETLPPNTANPNTGQIPNQSYLNIPLINQYMSLNGITDPTTVTVAWLNGSNVNNGGSFYYYPSAVKNDPPGTPDTETNGLDNTAQIPAPGRFHLDLTANKSPSYAGNEGWQDIGALMFELTAVPSATGNECFCDCTGRTSGTVVTGNANCPGWAASAPTACSCSIPTESGGTQVVPGVVRGVGLPDTGYEGGSWEGHSSFNPDPTVRHFNSDNGVGWATPRQYGKVGFRCARPAEPTR